MLVFIANLPSVPSGQWPDGTGESPVLPRNFRKQRGASYQAAEFFFCGLVMRAVFCGEIVNDFVFDGEPLQAGDANVLLLALPGLALLQFRFYHFNTGGKYSLMRSS